MIVSSVALLIVIIITCGQQTDETRRIPWTRTVINLTLRGCRDIYYVEKMCHSPQPQKIIKDVRRDGCLS